MAENKKLAEKLTQCCERRARGNDVIPSILVTGDYENIFETLKSWCDQNDITVISFFENCVLIYSKTDDSSEMVAFDFTDPQNIIGSTPFGVKIGGTTKLPQQVVDLLDTGKCLFYYEDLFGLDEDRRYRFLSRLIDQGALAQYNRDNLVAHVASKTEEQRLSRYELGKGYFFIRID